MFWTLTISHLFLAVCKGLCWLQLEVTCWPLSWDLERPNFFTTWVHKLINWTEWTQDQGSKSILDRYVPTSNYWSYQKLAPGPSNFTRSSLRLSFNFLNFFIYIAINSQQSCCPLLRSSCSPTPPPCIFSLFLFGPCQLVFFKLRFILLFQHMSI